MHPACMSRMGRAVLDPSRRAACAYRGGLQGVMPRLRAHLAGRRAA